jgi:hypothetical protein
MATLKAYAYAANFPDQIRRGVASDFQRLVHAHCGCMALILNN